MFANLPQVLPVLQIQREAAPEQQQQQQQEAVRWAITAVGQIGWVCRRRLGEPEVLCVSGQHTHNTDYRDRQVLRQCY